MRAKYATNAEQTINNNENGDCLASLIPDDEFFEILQELVNEYEKENDCDCDND